MSPFMLTSVSRVVIFLVVVCSPILAQQPHEPHTRRPEADIDSCDSRCKFLAARFKEATPAWEVLDKVVAEDTQIIAFGESHEHNKWNFYNQVVKHLQKRFADFDCVLLEARSDFQEFIAGAKIPTKDVIRAINIEMVKNDVRVLLDGNPTPPKIHLVDITFDEMVLRNGEAGANDTTAMNRRNIVMANKAKELFQNGSCHRALMIGGAAHLRGGEREVSIPELLQEGPKMKTFLIPYLEVSPPDLHHPELRMVMRRDEIFFDSCFEKFSEPRWDEPLQQFTTKVPLPDRDFGFIASKPSPRIGRHENPSLDRWEARWSDFDGILIHVNQLKDPSND